MLSRCELKCQARDGRYRMDVLLPRTPTTLKGIFKDVCFFVLPSEKVDRQTQQKYADDDQRLLESIWNRYTIQKTSFIGISDKQRDGIQYDSCYDNPDAGCYRGTDTKRYPYDELQYDKNGKYVQGLAEVLIMNVVDSFHRQLKKNCQNDVKKAIDAAKNDNW